MATPPSSPTKPNFRNISYTRLIIFILSTLTFFGIVILFTLLTLDAFTIPYLTPIAHFLHLIISPFIPLIVPTYLLIFLTIYSYPRAQWKGKKTWMIASGCWLFGQSDRTVKGFIAIWGDVVAGMWKGEGLNLGRACGLAECRAKWVEEGLIVVAVGIWLLGVRTPINRWVEAMARDEREKELKENGGDMMEKGESLVRQDESDVIEEKESVAQDGSVVDRQDKELSI